MNSSSHRNDRGMVDIDDWQPAPKEMSRKQALLILSGLALLTGYLLVGILCLGDALVSGPMPDEPLQFFNWWWTWWFTK